MTADPALKKCPHCSELIQADARICRYCGRSVAPNMIAAEKWGQLGKSMQGIGCLLTLLVTVPICICLGLYLLGSQ